MQQWRSVCDIFAIASGLCWQSGQSCWHDTARRGIAAGCCCSDLSAKVKSTAKAATQQLLQ